MTDKNITHLIESVDTIDIGKSAIEPTVNADTGVKSFGYKDPDGNARRCLTTDSRSFPKRYSLMGDSILSLTNTGGFVQDKLEELNPNGTFVNTAISGSTLDHMVRGGAWNPQLLINIGTMYFDFANRTNPYPFEALNSAYLFISDSVMQVINKGVADPAARITVINDAHNITVTGQFAGDGTSNMVIKDKATGSTLATSTTSATLQNFSFQYVANGDGDGFDFICNGGTTANYCTVADISITDDDYIKLDALIWDGGVNSTSGSLSENIDIRNFMIEQINYQLIESVCLAIHPVFHVMTSASQQAFITGLNDDLYTNSRANYSVDFNQMGNSDFEAFIDWRADPTNLHNSQEGAYKYGELINDQYFLGKKHQVPPSDYKDAETIQGVPVSSDVPVSGSAKSYLLTQQDYWNNVLHASDISNAAWTKTAMTPDGTDGLIADVGTGSRRVQQNGIGLEGINEWEVLAEKGSTEWILVYIGGNGVWFNLNTGATGNTVGTVASNSITDNGDGRWTCKIQAEATASDTAYVYAASGNGQYDTTGDGTTVSIRVSKFMLSGDITVADNMPHIETTTAAASAPGWFYEERPVEGKLTNAATEAVETPVKNTLYIAPEPYQTQGGDDTVYAQLISGTGYTATVTETIHGGGSVGKVIAIEGGCYDLTNTAWLANGYYVSSSFYVSSKIVTTTLNIERGASMDDVSDDTHMWFYFTLA